MANNSDHSFVIRVFSEEGEMVLEDTDFSVDGRVDWFEEILRQSDEGEVVQLVDTSDNRVIFEKVRD